MTPTSAATRTQASQNHQGISVRPTFGLQVIKVFSQIRGFFMLSTKTRGQRQRRRRAEDETGAIELANLNEMDVVSAEEGKDSCGGILSNGRDSSHGD